MEMKTQEASDHPPRRPPGSPAEELRHIEVKQDPQVTERSQTPKDPRRSPGWLLALPRAGSWEASEQDLPFEVLLRDSGR